MTNFIPFAKLTIRSDFMFKKVMSIKRICKHLIEEVLQTPIADISYLETEKTIEPSYGSRGIRLDVTVADENHTHYNLEMQVKNLKNPDTGVFVLPKRTRYYQAMIDMDSLQKGQEYDLLPPTYIIFICVFDFFEQGNYIYTFKKRCLENLELELPDETTTMFLNTLGTHGNITKDVKSFFDYVNSHVITSDFTQEIDEEVTEIKHNKKARDEYMLWEAMKTDLKREGYAEGRVEGHAEGLAEGRVEGHAEGLAEGRVEGRTEGKNEEKFAIARRMLTLGRSLQDIMLITDLPLAQIHKLQAELKA